MLAASGGSSSLVLSTAAVLALLGFVIAGVLLAGVLVVWAISPAKKWKADGRPGPGGHSHHGRPPGRDRGQRQARHVHRGGAAGWHGRHAVQHLPFRGQRPAPAHLLAGGREPAPGPPAGYQRAPARHTHSAGRPAYVQDCRRQFGGHADQPRSERHDQVSRGGPGDAPGLSRGAPPEPVAGHPARRGPAFSCAKV